MVVSPTQRTLGRCRKNGWSCQVVERWNPYAKIRIDLFGCIDLVALDDEPGALGIQATSTGNMSSRVAKALEIPHLRRWLASGCRYEVWGWAKRGPAGKRKLWKLRRVRLVLDGDEIRQQVLA